MSGSALPGGPSWLGIGAQRSGTTWFTDLLTQHPQVGLGTNGKKEQHLLHKVADGVLPASEYLDLFPADDVRRGEWTPQYLRHASVPAAAARLVPDAPVLVLLRDPVERFRSAMRLAATRAAAGNPSPWPYPVPITMQTFTGFYADQLAAWAAAVGRERMVVMVYEQVRRAPQAAVDGRLAPARPRPGAAGRGRRGLRLQQPGRLGLAGGAQGVAAGDVPAPARPPRVRLGARRQRLDRDPLSRPYRRGGSTESATSRTTRVPHGGPGPDGELEGAVGEPGAAQVASSATCSGVRAAR